MRFIFASLALPLLAGAASAEAPAGVDNGVRADVPAAPSPANCRDRIHEVREERGLPRLLDRRNATPGEAEALMLYAVQRRIDGCDVLVMANDPQDVRPLPPFNERGAMIPAEPRAQ